MQASAISSVSPSFSSYSNNKLTEIAARVVHEFKQQPGSEENKSYLHHEEQAQQNSEREENDEDSEFTFACRGQNSSPIAADEIFYNGKIRPIYPIFNTALLPEEPQNLHIDKSPNTSKASIRLPLKKLFMEERDSTSCSSSESVELEGVPQGTYCVWRPKGASPASAEESPNICKKSNSTGTSSKRWKLKDLLHRSSSDGKETFAFPVPSKKKENGISAENEAREAIYVKNGATLKGKSNISYREELLGFFGNVNGLSRNLHPF